MRACVAGAGGMIGGHLVKALLDQGHEVIASDIKEPKDWWQMHDRATNLFTYDLREAHCAWAAVQGCEQVYDLAEEMGGIGFIENNRVECSESIEIGISLLRASHKTGVKRFFFASSACVYNTDLQKSPFSMSPFGLIEEDAWPAKPEEGYGFSKLYMEELCRHYTNEKGLETRIARYHNVYGSPGSWNDGKEKAPAALTRKVAEATMLGNPHTIDIWGDGTQLRSYLHVSDCIDGTIALMNSECRTPINIGSTRDISVNDLVTLIEGIAGINLERNYQLDAPKGVANRNADIDAALLILGWEPKVSLEVGMAKLFKWICDELS
jgi:GDP-D-mannose 3',5'-epimerase